MLLASCGGSASLQAPRLVETNAAQACQALAKDLRLEGSAVNAAAYLPAGFVPPGSSTALTQPFCRVQLTSRPSADSEITSEIWMPALGFWNERFLAIGGSGSSGSIMYPDMGSGLTKGYATLSTDNGHQGQDQIFAVGHPEKVIDFGHRAQAVTAVAGKAVTQAFYGKTAKKAYWLGCSQGGGEGMMQSQRYPENFDGIVAGAPVFD